MALRKRQEPIQEKVLDVDASMQGTMAFRDPVNLKINGKFEGKLDTKGKLMVGEHATVNADIKGEQITVAGKVNGNISATKDLKVISPAHIIGDIATPLLSVAEGAIIDGNIKMSAGGRKGKESLSAEDVAKFLEVDTSMVVDWADNGKLPGIKDGNSWRFDKNKIDEWIANEKVK